MKLNNIFAFLQIFLLFSSSVLAVKERISISRGHSRRSRRLSANKVLKFNTRDCPRPEFDFISFIKGIHDAGTVSIEDLIVDSIVSKMKLESGTEECLGQVEEAFNKKVKDAEKEVEIMAKKGLNNIMDQVKSLNMMRGYEIELLDRLKANPKEFCEKARKSITYYTKPHNERKSAVEKILKNLEDHKKWTLEDWEENSRDGIFTSHNTKSEIYDKLLHLTKNHKDKSYNHIYEMVIKHYTKEIEEISEILKNSAAIVKLDCSSLPEEEDLKRNCFQVSIGVKARQLWELISQPDTSAIKKCLKVILTEKLLVKLVSVAITTVLNSVLNILGFFVVSILKAVLFAFYFTARLIKATKSKNVSERSQAMGEAVGFAYRLVLATLQVGRKRRLK
jgi:hypothetical protein